MFAYESAETTSNDDMSIPKTAVCIWDIQTKQLLIQYVQFMTCGSSVSKKFNLMLPTILYHNALRIICGPPWLEVGKCCPCILPPSYTHINRRSRRPCRPRPSTTPQLSTYITHIISLHLPNSRTVDQRARHLRNQRTLKNLLHSSGSPFVFMNSILAMSSETLSTITSPVNGHRRESVVWILIHTGS